jgi:HPt (histidine-containing phosphotransfer) domain-containing protein
LQLLTGQAVASADVTDGEYKDLRSLVHQMAGSGAVYGFPAVSQLARAIDDSICQNPRAEDEVIIGQLKQLLTVCRVALASAPLSTP